MRGFDAANKIVGESVGVHGCAIADDPVLQRLSLCVDDLLPALSRACRVYGDGAAMHAMIALTASMAREDGLEESIAEAFRVNAAMLDNRPLRHMPRPGINSTMPLYLKRLVEWFQQRLNQFLAGDGLKHQAALSTSSHNDSSQDDEKEAPIQDCGLAAQQ
ncbi:MAG: hypothetical protein DHS20C04_08780 [Hyphococcus sp.]|nr:MAG: hypothetical protein DHS20C04_08780 [Marinicaulis sp.]